MTIGDVNDISSTLSRKYYIQMGKKGFSLFLMIFLHVLISEWEETRRYQNSNNKVKLTLTYPGSVL